MSKPLTVTSRNQELFVAGSTLAISRYQDDTYQGVQFIDAIKSLTGVEVPEPGSDYASTEYGEHLVTRSGYKTTEEYLKLRTGLLGHLGTDGLAAIDSIVKTEGEQNV